MWVVRRQRVKRIKIPFRKELATSLRFSRWCCRRFKNLLRRYSTNFPKFQGVTVPSALGSIGSRKGPECLEPEEDNTVIVRRVAVPHPSTSVTQYSSTPLWERQIALTEYLSPKVRFFLWKFTIVSCLWHNSIGFFYQICVEIVFLVLYCF